MAIGNKRYIHFNAQKRETIRQNIGRGTFTMLSPTKFLEGDMSPVPTRLRRLHLLLPTYDTLMQNGKAGSWNAIRINPSG